MQALYTAILVLVFSVGFVQTLFESRARVDVAFPILLSSSTSKERLSVMVDPRYVNWWTTSSWKSSIAIPGAVEVSVASFLTFS